MSDIYELHRKAFERVSAFVLMKGSERVATVALKFPADGAGRLYAYVHLIGGEMQRAQVSGYGYDKRSAAVARAIRMLPRYGRGDYENPDSDYARAYEESRAAMLGAVSDMDSGSWERALEKAGFTVLQAV